jgi:hypothetical protein
MSICVCLTVVFLTHKHRLLIPDRTLERDVKKFVKDRILTNLKVP